MVIAGEEVRHVTWLHRIEQAEILSELTDDRHNVLVYVSYLRRVDLRSTGFSLTNATSSSSSLMRTPSSTGFSLIRISLSVRWSLAWSFSNLLLDLWVLFEAILVLRLFLGLVIGIVFSFDDFPVSWKEIKVLECI
jgi:hypothetical protein